MYRKSFYTKCLRRMKKKPCVIAEESYWTALHTQKYDMTWSKHRWENSRQKDLQEQRMREQFDLQDFDTVKFRAFLHIRKLQKKR
jgi:hypothetical protein